MNIDIKLYVHGVPKGNDTWGEASFDSNYIETFYGRKSNVPVQMLVEVRQFGSAVNSYYTYLRTGNVSDCDGRTGSFVALTLRINYYYADIQNIYNLLDAAYNKFIVGSIVAVSGGYVKYLISNFAQKNSELKSLEEELKHYLLQFSSDSDYMSFGGFRANTPHEPANVNLLECDVTAVAKYVKSNGPISVSPLHPSKREQQIIRNADENVKNANANAQRLINEDKRSASRDVETARTQARQDILAAQKEKEDGIQAIREQYKDADKTISELRRDIASVQKENARMRDCNNELTAKLNSVLVYKDEYGKIKKELDDKNVLLEKVRKGLSGLSEVAETLEMSLNMPTVLAYESGKKTKKEQTFVGKHGDVNNGKRFSVKGFVRGVIPIIVIIVVIALLGILAFIIFR